MSSHIRIEKVCEYCKNQFIAKTIKTRYCSHNCNSKAYKTAQRVRKIKTVTDSSIGNLSLKVKVAFADYDVLAKKELLTIAEASLLLNITCVTLRRWIKDGFLKTSRIGKKHIITRSDINKTLLN